MTLNPNWKDAVRNLVRDTCVLGMAEDLKARGTLTKEEAREVMKEFKRLANELMWHDIWSGR